MEDSDLDRILEPEQARAALSHLIGQDAPIPASGVARSSRTTLTELFTILSELTLGGYVVLHPEIAIGREVGLSISQERGHADQLMKALNRIEMRFIAERASSYNVEAASKLLAIDDLADAVMVAREQVRKRANFL